MTPTITSASATPSTNIPAPATSSTTSTSAQENTLRLSVSGEATTAMVKTLVITRNGKEQNGQMTRQNLPFSRDVTLPAGSELVKVLVLGKNIDGASTKLTCSIDLAGETLKKSSSNGHAPAECLLLDAGSKSRNQKSPVGGWLREADPHGTLSVIREPL